MIRDAVFSSDRKYRYLLSREWDPVKGKISFIGLNPSTADENAEDPTTRRCINFAKSWGYGGLYMVNLFAYRATKPKDMRVCKDPIGKDNDTVLVESYLRSSIVVAAWGTHGSFRNRDLIVCRMLPELSILMLEKERRQIPMLTLQGQPRHPLYLKSECYPTLWDRTL